MKLHQILIGLFLLLLVGGGIYLATGAKPEQHNIILIWDSSSEDIPRPSAEQLATAINSIPLYDGIHLELHQLNDRLLKDEYELSISSANKLLSNQDERQKEWETFLNQVDSLLVNKIDTSASSGES